jgi:hypothetical protein
LHAIPHGVALPGVHVAVPLLGTAHTFPHVTQLFVSLGSKHVPLQSSVVLPLHATVHIPVVHCAIPIPASGPGHTLLHEPQWFGSFDSFTHTPLQSTVPASQLGPVSTGASIAEPSPGLPVSATLLSLVPESTVPVSPIIDESTTVPLSTSPSAPASVPPPPHVLLSAQVPNVSVPQPAASSGSAASPVNPTQSPSVTA